MRSRRADTKRNVLIQHRAGYATRNGGQESHQPLGPRYGILAKGPRAWSGLAACVSSCPIPILPTYSTVLGSQLLSAAARLWWGCHIGSDALRATVLMSAGGTNCRDLSGSFQLFQCLLSHSARCRQWVKSANSISEPAAVRSALERGWGHQSLSARFVDFFTAIAMTSNVCYGLQSGHSRREFFGA
jgi:hypothetical protein